MRLQRFLLSPDAGAGDGGTADKNATAAGKPDADTVATLVRKNAELERDNADFRRKNRGLKDELATARESKSLPADIDAELAAYRALGKPESLKELATFKASVERDRSLAEIAREAGVTNVPAFLKVAADPAMYEVRREEKDGKKAASVFVKGEGKGDPVAFDDFHKDFLPALKPDAEATPRGPRGTPRRESPQHASAPLTTRRDFTPLGEEVAAQAASGRYAPI